MSIATLRSGSAPKYFANHTDLEELALGPASAGDVLVAIEGGTIGESMVVPDDFEPFAPSQQVATIRFLKWDRVDPWYLGAWLSTEHASEQLRRLARGSGIQRIAMKDLPALVLAVPSVETQREIGERFRAFDRAIRAHRAITSCLEDLRSLDLTVTFAEATNIERTGQASAKDSRRDVRSASANSQRIR